MTETHVLLGRLPGRVHPNKCGTKTGRMARHGWGGGTERGGPGEGSSTYTTRIESERMGLAVRFGRSCCTGLCRLSSSHTFPSSRAPRPWGCCTRLPDTQPPVVDEVLVRQSQPQSEVPDSAREGRERARECQKGQGMPDLRRRASRQISLRWTCLSRSLVRELSVGLAHMHRARGAGPRKRLVYQAGRIWRDRGATCLGPAQYRVTSLYCVGNITMPTGREA
ncbi:hypothetical protein N658DRAFT_105397 [Parathielavia hyrcaniae]|uniref:Uncharacterized protein n=1 Tax=Parathielavia hyrcaniae TaxID=113614 RepID=A0AAN6T0H4_9PEZI|nr:hypothetical protein N658DRAFT_105397 [Parathielavia hyrcaniae]